MNNIYEIMDELKKLVAHLRQQTKPEQIISVYGMTSEQFREYADKLMKSISESQRSLGCMAVIGGKLASVFAETTESLIKAKREVENGIRESWIIVLDHFMPEKWARCIVSKIPNRVIWWTIR